MRMIYVYVLAVWGFLIVITLVTDSIVICRTLAGRNGQDSLVLFLGIAERHGGVRRRVVINLARDLFEPRLIWQGMLSARR
jgi:hypothetical protein